MLDENYQVIRHPEPKIDKFFKYMTNMTEQAYLRQVNWYKN